MLRKGPEVGQSWEDPSEASACLPHSHTQHLRSVSPAGGVRSRAGKEPTPRAVGCQGASGHGD